LSDRGDLFEQALTANALLGALFAVAFHELDVHAAGSNPGFQPMIPPASRLVAASPDAVDGSLK
jgi:hypothetical protein